MDIEKLAARAVKTVEGQENKKGPGAQTSEDAGRGE